MLRSVSRRTKIKKYGDKQWLLDVDNQLIHHSADTLKFRIGALGLLIIVCILAYIYMNEIFMAFNSFLQWIMIHPWKGSILYIFVYGLAAVFMVPAFLLSLGAGFIYSSIYGSFKGVIFAFFVDYFGATFGAVLSFWVSRFLFYEWIEKWTKNYPTFQIAQKLLKINAIKVVLILRVLMPYHILNYLLGVTNITTYEYIIGCFGMVIPTFITCCIGSTITKISELHEMHGTESQIWQFLKDNVLIGMIVIVIFGFVSYKIGKKAYSEFNKMKKDLEEDEKGIVTNKSKHVINVNNLHLK